MNAECHGHIILDGVDYHKATQPHRVKLNQERIEQTLSLCREQNIRFYRDGGDNLGATGYAASVASQFGIDYRTPVFAIHKKNHYGSMFGKCFETMEQYRQLVAQVAQAKGDFIKIMVSGIMDFNIYGKLTGGTLPREEIFQMVQIAHDAGFAVMAHVNTAEQIAWCLEAGADSIEHGYYMDDRCISLLHNTDAVWVPTFAPVARLLTVDLFPHDVLHRILNLHCNNLCKAVSLGVNIACGSDAGSYLVPPAKGCALEMEYLKEAVPQSQQTLLSQCLDRGETLIKQKFRRT